jgi:RNA polymerase sigma-70 factor (ECF subfamily)
MDTDEQLFARLRQGDMAAFDRLYARHERRLFGFILRMLHDRGDAEEVFHDTFLNVLKAGQVHFREARFAAWLYRIARNLCANRLRSKRRGFFAVEKLKAPAEEFSPSPEELAAHEERSFALAGAVERLPEALADVFHLRTSGLSYEEIAGVLEIPLGTVKSRMNTLVQQLKGELSS